MSFPTGFSGDPRFFQRRVGWETQEGVPSRTLYDFLCAGGPITPSPAPVKRLGIRASAMALPSLRGPLKVPDPTIAAADLNPGSKAQNIFLANALGAFDTEDLSGGAYRHTLSQLGGTRAPESFTLLEDPNVGVIDRYHSGVAKGFSLDAKPGGNLALSVPIVVGKVDGHGDAVQTTGSGSTPPQLRCTTDLSWLARTDGSDQDVYVKVVTAPAGGVVVLQSKVGTAGTYSGNQTVALDQWTYLLNDAGTYYGTEAERPEILVETSDTLTDGNIFKYPANRTRWTPAFPVDRSVPLVNAHLLCAPVGEPLVEFPLDGGFTLSVAIGGAKRLEGTAYQASGCIRSGEQAVTVKGSRQIRDLVYQLALRRQVPLAMVLQAFTDIRIGATAFKFGHEFIFPQLAPSGATFGVKDGAADRTESIELIAGEPDEPLTYQGVEFSADVAARWTTDVALVV